jgi:hypothetical protein
MSNCPVKFVRLALGGRLGQIRCNFGHSLRPQIRMRFAYEGITGLPLQQSCRADSQEVATGGYAGQRAIPTETAWLLLRLVKSRRGDASIIYALATRDISYTSLWLRRFSNLW